MTFKLEIEMGNDAMQSPADVGRVLADIALSHLTASHFHDGDSCDALRDINGNTIGYWEVTA